jgi:hypothetical protein
MLVYQRVLFVGIPYFQTEIHIFLGSFGCFPIPFPPVLHTHGALGRRTRKCVNGTVGNPVESPRNAAKKAAIATFDYQVPRL